VYRLGWGDALGKSGQEDGGCRDFVEGKIFGGASGALLPSEEEASVAVCEAGGGVDAETGQGAVDPCGRALQFCVVADGGFVEDEVTTDGEFGGKSWVGKERAVDGGGGMGPLGAELLVAEDGLESELMEDGGEGWAVVEEGLGLDADFIAGRGAVAGRIPGADQIAGACRIAVRGGVCRTLVGDDPEIAVVANTKDLLDGPEGAGGGVVEGVLLEGAGRIELEAEAGKTRLQAGEIVDGELELDLGGLHWLSIRRGR